MRPISGDWEIEDIKITQPDESVTEVWRVRCRGFWQRSVRNTAELSEIYGCPPLHAFREAPASEQRVQAAVDRGERWAKS